MKMCHEILVISYAILALSACQYPPRSETHSAPPPPAREATPVPKAEIPHSAPLLAKVEALSEPNRYQVNLSWNDSPADAERWLLFREGAKLSLEQIALNQEQERTHGDATVIAGETYRYFLYSFKGGEKQLRAQVSIAIPKDLLVENQMALHEVKGFRRLFLKKGAVLKPQQDTLRVDVEELISDDGTIAGAAFGKNGERNANGTDGGRIIVKAQRASGFLRINADGGEGGGGDDGERGDPGRDGDRGSRAEIKPPFMICVKHPGNGTPGGNGGQGKPGRKGGNGGNTANLFVRIKSAQGFDLKVSHEPGQGKAGGKPGPGGPGGRGGEPGENVFPCLPAQPGPRGQEGPSHPSAGAHGEKGSVSPYCLHIEGIKEGDCENENFVADSNP